MRDCVKMETKTASTKRVYISLPKKCMAALAEHYELEHGLVIYDLNPYLQEAYVQAYFREWGTMTSCKIKRSSASGKDKVVAFVIFSTENEADSADWAGPHYIGGMEVKVKQIVSPKCLSD
ncbi:heterogeneous nuclear ribonucleoprotein A2 homolog 1 [Parambassis ranga]|uniref:Heterogeneous nuclear ribonucleoprotein A2 homolog 1 n=1 Tax=Parambassis ranga TaxID=210632 RepID=A0A6P7IPN5_9TELE|nr:heterogeneous nuclear ribonucleoprotein A2 homolog 1-like [Parambassis ranga]